MNVFGKDMVIGDFKLSDYGLFLGTFETDANYEDELNNDFETIESYIGHNPVPKYLGSKYTNKLQPKATLLKDSCVYKDNLSFTEHECREILRQLTGFRGYRNLQILSSEFDELLYFNVRVVKVSYQKVGGDIVAINLYMECDSQFAWSKEFNYTYTVQTNNPIVLYNNSDDLHNYLFPKIVISSTNSIDKLEIINITDSNYTTIIENIEENEVITMDSKNDMLTSSIADKIILNNFNMNFIRLVSGKNELVSNQDINLSISYRVPRKVGFV